MFTLKDINARKHTEIAEMLGVEVAELKKLLDSIYITSVDGELKYGTYNKIGDVFLRKRYVRKVKTSS